MARTRVGMARWWWAAGLGLGLAACGDSTGPAGEFDPVADDAAVDEMAAAIQSNPALQSMAALQNAAPSFAAVPLPPSPSAATDGSAVERLRAEWSRLAEIAPRSSATLAHVVPDSLKGRTYVYDPAQDRYVWDPDRSDAPARGIRFALYAVNPITGAIVEDPLTEIGYVDMLEPSPTAISLRIVAAVGNVTHVDYTVSVAATASGGSLRAAGFVTDGTNRVNFDLRVAFDEAENSVTFDYLLDAARHGVRLHWVLDLRVDPATGFGTISGTFEIRSPRGTVLFVITVEETESGEVVSGEIRFNGRRVVTIGGTTDAVHFTKENGEPLTEEEIAALRDLFEALDDLSDFFERLFAPLGLFGAA